MRSRQRGFLLDPYRFGVTGVTPLLDALGSPATSGAYSLRRLRAAYAGHCVHVRKVGDATGIDVDFVGNDLDTSAITTYAAGGAATASVWPDQGSSVFANLDTTSQTVDPAIADGSGALFSTAAGRFGIKFNGTSQLFKHTSAGTTGQPYTRLLVLRFDSIASGQDIYSNGVDNAIYFQASGRVDVYAGTTQAVKTGISAADYACVIISVNAGSTGASYNGVETATLSPGTSGVSHRALGGAWNGTTASAWAAITVVEDVLFTAATTSTTRTSIYNNVKAYWGTP